MASSMGSYSAYPEASGYGNLGGGVEALSALSSVYSPSMNGFAGPFGGYGAPEANFLPAAAYASPIMSPFMSPMMAGGYEASPYAGPTDSGEGPSPAAPGPRGPRGGRGGNREEEEHEYGQSGRGGRPRRPAPPSGPSGDDEPQNERESSSFNGKPETSQYYRPPEVEHGNSPPSGGDYDNSPSSREYGHRHYDSRGRSYDYE